MPASRKRLIAAAATAAVMAVPTAGCGDDSAADDASEGRPAPASSAFPAPDGRTLDELLADSTPGDLVASPAASVFTEGRNRLPFALFTVDRQQITDADVAIYTAPSASAPAQGPFPARVESLATEPAFTARTTSEDPEAGKVVYVSDVVLDRPGEWRLLAVIDHGGESTAVRLPSATIEPRDPIPAPGERAPSIHTPTAADVGGDLTKIDTRVPHSTMHSDDLADVLGKDPVVLFFATPALCQTRVCGPIIDIGEQVKRDYNDEAAFIHMEIYEDNDPNKGVREQVRAYDLDTEPWTFVIDRNGRIDTRIEGAFSVDELERAVERVTG